MNKRIFRAQLATTFLVVTALLLTMAISYATSYAESDAPTQPRVYLPLLFRATATAGTECPSWVHDQYKVQGPDGKMYPTWHPPVDPTYGCYFGHEHGDDPTKSLADPTLPPFGYIGQSMSMDEPHVGFKVFVVNKGTHYEGYTAIVNSRIVAHMGTGGVKRYTERMHSLEYDLVAPDGRYVHVQGMADTGLAGDICQRDVSLQNSDPNDDIGRTFVVLPNSCAENGRYEAWVFNLRVGTQARVFVSTAAFDPMLTMNPNNLSQVIRTDDVWGGVNLGCKREAYHGPVYWYEADPNSQTVFYTDALGSPGGPLRQEVSRSPVALGIPMSKEGNTVFKWFTDQCARGLKLPN